MPLRGPATNAEDESETPEVKQGKPALDDLKDAFDTSEIEVKQAVLDHSAIQAARKRVKFYVPGLVGSFGAAKFGSNNITTAPVDEKTAEAIRKTFPSAQEVE